MGGTSYFYQDAALAQKLNGSTLYLTGKEQANHFKQLKEIKPNIKHLGLGLITLNGKKMSSRAGNTILMYDLIDEVIERTQDSSLAYNILASKILASNPTRDLKVNLDELYDVNTSYGLYLSYTCARLHNLPIRCRTLDCLDPTILFITYKSKITLNPSLLFNYLIKYCKKINRDYDSINSSEDSELFHTHCINVSYMVESLGLFFIKKLINQQNESN